MYRVKFPVWSDEVEKAITEIYRVEDQMQNMINELKVNTISYNDFEQLFNNVFDTLCYWTGNTYIGQEKDKTILKAFQSFYEALYKFLLICREHDEPMFRNFAEKVLYRGVAYRYLGHGMAEENTNKRIEPQYNNIYVSWSKRSQNDYIESKLYGTMTLLECRIEAPHYGIDLETFGVTRANEAEVVFPTMKEMITDIKYI